MRGPGGFCWSKFGVEAGEPAESILARKEHERRLNGGIFLWGIGTSIWPSLQALLQVNKSPTIVFSPMLSRPAKIDVMPDCVAVWTTATGMDGSKYEFPQHSFVSSRVTPSRVRRHFALVCATDAEIRDRSTDGQCVYRSELRNYLSNNELGASQVTAVVRRIKEVATRLERPHRIAFKAQLTYPYLVELQHPQPIGGVREAFAFKRPSQKKVGEQTTTLKSRL
jgi:hypothetical protein